jgi:hypothetical protein
VCDARHASSAGIVGLLTAWLQVSYSSWTTVAWDVGIPPPAAWLAGPLRPVGAVEALAWDGWADAAAQWLTAAPAPQPSAGVAALLAAVDAAVVAQATAEEQETPTADVGATQARRRHLGRTDQDAGAGGARWRGAAGAAVVAGRRGLCSGRWGRGARRRRRRHRGTPDRCPGLHLPGHVGPDEQPVRDEDESVHSWR